MAKVKIQKRCKGPISWETIKGVRKLTPLNICGTEVNLEYDDSTSLERMVGETFGARDIYCDSCANSGNRMLEAHESRMKKMYDSKHGYAKFKDSGASRRNVEY